MNKEEEEDQNQANTYFKNVCPKLKLNDLQHPNSDSSSSTLHTEVNSIDEQRWIKELGFYFKTTNYYENQLTYEIDRRI